MQIPKLFPPFPVSAQALVYLSVFLLTVLCASRSALPPNEPLPSATLVHQFPLAFWAGDLAVRASSEVLATMHPPAELYQMDPTAPLDFHSDLVRRFSGATAVTGIAECAPDYRLRDCWKSLHGGCERHAEELGDLVC